MTLNSIHVRQFFRRIVFFPWTLFINFRYFNFRKAIKLPIHCTCRICFRKATGHICIEGPVKTGMIIIGGETNRFSTRKPFFWQVEGTLIFKGSCLFTDDIFLNCNKNGIIEFGDGCVFAIGNKIICSKEIVFGKKIRSSWNCTYIDTDFHGIIDNVSGRPLKINESIKIQDGCWMGHDCIISKGVKLPKNTIVSSGSVVKGKFKKENCIIAGNLATVVDEGFVRDDCASL